MKIDIHTHILPPSVPDMAARSGHGGWIELKTEDDGQIVMHKDGEFFRRVQKNCILPEDRLADMDRTGVNVQVLSTVPVMFNYAAKGEDTAFLARYLNDHIAGLVRSHPRRFIGLGTLPMQDAALSVEELKRCKTIGLAGIEIGTHINDLNLDATVFDPIYRACEELNMPIFVHPWDMCSHGERGSAYWLPWLVGMPANTAAAIVSVLFGGVLDRFPKLRMCFAHGGGSFPILIGRVAHGHACRPDLCAHNNPRSPTEYLGRFYTDSLVHDDAAFAYLISRIGSDRVILGSDYPFPLGELEPPGAVVDRHSDTELREKVSWRNGFEFLGIDSTLYE